MLLQIDNGRCGLLLHLRYLAVWSRSWYVRCFVDKLINRRAACALAAEANTARAERHGGPNTRHLVITREGTAIVDAAALRDGLAAG